MKLIPNDITVSEQHAIRDRFSNQVDKWEETQPARERNDKYLDQLVNASGVKCQFLRGRLIGFNIVDEKKYAWFLLKWG